jgi:putative hydrolase of the HAD superfamily
MNGRLPIELVLVDYDDTLVDTAPRFLQARRLLFALLEEAGISEETARRIHHDQVEPRMLDQYGFGPRRLEPSFRATYEAGCEALGLRVDPTMLERCAEVGRAVAGTPPPIEGALPALERLAKAYRTVLYTQAGDAEYQLRCLRDSGLYDLLGESSVRICERKSVHSFREVLSSLGVEEPAAVWMVGNSIRSDVNPALEAGAHAILVEVADPWEFDVVDPVSNDFVKVRSFADAVAFLLEEGT